jgi:Zn-dependent protease with chaperone function
MLARLTLLAVAAQNQIDKYELGPELRARAESFAHARHLIYLVGTVWGIAVLLVLLRLRVAVHLQRWTERRTQRRWLQSVLFAPPFLLVLALLELPLGVWSHVQERRYGLSIQGWGSFARDWAVGQVLALLLGALLVTVLYAVMRRSVRRWWLWTWVAVLPILLFVVFLEPFVVEPLFFKFSPLDARNAPLADRLQAIAKKGGEEVPRERMFVMDASEKLRSVNAYVTGFGASKRVVVWDTTLGAMQDREIAFVFGHELGHYVLGHVIIGLVAGAAGLLLSLFLGAQAIRWIVRRRGERLGIFNVDELASLPLLLLAFTLMSTVASPVGAAFSRHLEHQADVFGLDVIKGVVDDPPQAAAHAFQRLGEIDLAEPDPSPLVVFWLYDHPAIRDRVAFVVGK